MRNLANPLVSFFFGAHNDDDMAPALGKVWQGHEALKSFKAGDLFSNDAGPPIRICMRYLVEEQDETNLHASRRRKQSVWVGWVNAEGKLRAFRKLHPVARSSVDNKTVTKGDHMEQSFLGHAFVFVVRDADDNDEEQNWKVESIDEATVIGGYRPLVLSTDPGIEEDDYPCHMLEISETKVPSFLRCSCQPTPKASSSDFPLVVREGNCLETLDTSSKEYIQEKICRLPVCVEKDCFDKDNEQIKDIIKKDLDYAISCLPGHALNALKASNTCIFVNKTFECGPKVQPVKAKALCFHPSKDWLVSHGYSADKAGCVELYDTADYMKDRDLWGGGGVLIHELSHAYHNKCLPQGYENPEIIECYQQAMEEGLYDCVKVHGPQGPTAKAYACENAMEYFAELSTAFLGGTRSSEEYNKWYPFNRSQIKDHDPRAYDLLCKMWKMRPWF